MKYALAMGGLVGVVLLVWHQLTSPALISPLATPSPSLPPPATSPLTLYGFMPYWNVSRLTDNHSIPNIIIYSGITLNEEGLPVTDAGSAALKRQAFTRLQESLTRNHQQLHLSFTLFSTPTIEALLHSNSARASAITSIIKLMQEHQATGLNLDFEPNSALNHETAALFTQFVSELHEALKNHSLQPLITVAIFGRISPDSLWELPHLSSTVDAFILMAYDYHSKSSSVAGPVAPVFGSGSLGRWNSDVAQSLWRARQQLPPEQLILGIPFYGYQWSVVSTQPGSQTFPGTGVTATYERVQTMLATGGVAHWDHDALSPWFMLEDSTGVSQIYFENQQSIAYKLALAQQSHLHGVAIWALGYEGEADDLWQPFANISTSPAHN